MIPEGYKLVFEDDFNGDTLDLTKWSYRATGPRRCGYNSPDRVRVENGNLILSQKYCEGEFGEGWYGGMIKANPRFCRGYFEIRCICNEHHRNGDFWSAFWLQADHPYEPELSLGGPGGAEIDIIECTENMGGQIGVESNIHVAGMTRPHTEGDGTDHMPVVRLNVPGCCTAYHTYALEWTDEVYRFYFDGKLYCETDWGDGVSRVVEDLIVSIELPSSCVQPKDKASEFIVDYVRVYQRESDIMAIRE